MFQVLKLKNQGQKQYLIGFSNMLWTPFLLNLKVCVQTMESLDSHRRKQRNNTFEVTEHSGVLDTRDILTTKPKLY